MDVGQLGKDISSPGYLPGDLPWMAPFSNKVAAAFKSADLQDSFLWILVALLDRSGRVPGYCTVPYCPPFMKTPIVKIFWSYSNESAICFLLVP